MAATAWVLAGLFAAGWLAWEVHRAPLMPDDYGKENT